MQAETDEPSVTEAGESFIGFGLSGNGLIGLANDDNEVHVHSLGDVFAVTLFDAEGRIACIDVDQL